MNISVIGTGNVGGALGKLWTAKGHNVMFGTRGAADKQIQQTFAICGR